MPPVLFKSKKADATCAKLVEFEDLPNWSDLASKIAQDFLILPEDVGVAYVDEARDSFNLTNEQDLRRLGTSLPCKSVNLTESCVQATPHMLFRP